jgi:hypothetical protein
MRSGRRGWSRVFEFFLGVGGFWNLIDDRNWIVLELL